MARRWDTALRVLNAITDSDDQALLWCAWQAETLANKARLDGDGAAARASDQLALRNHERHASGATSGGEGMSRMLDVHRLRERLALRDDDDNDDDPRS